MKKWLICILLALTQSTLAQDPLQSMMEKNLRDRMSERSTQAPSLLTAMALEKEVDPDEYYVGPGDQFLIQIGGAGSDNIETTVSPEGELIITAVGAIPVANKTLTEAKRITQEYLSVKYVSKTIGIHLVKPRLFKVSVTGAILEPGSVEVTAMSRAAEAIDLAGGLKQRMTVETLMQQVTIKSPVKEETSLQTTKPNPQVKYESYAGSQRNILIKRRTGESVPVDLQKFNLTGDLKANPFLRDGDVIIVPTEETSAGRVYIAGALKNPDIFEFAPGDCVGDLITMAHGFTTDADSSKIELVRFKGTGSNTTRELLHLPADNPQARERSMRFPLQPDDRLFVRFQYKFHETRNIEIEGEVLYPGFYALEEGEIRLSEMIERAGGFSSEASLKNAYIQRRAQEDVLDPEFERLKKMSVLEMTESERDYFKIKSRERTGGMGVDFVALFEKGDKSQDVILRDHDLIHIPAQEMTVKVTGQVLNPGLYPYKPNMNVKHYLTEAGGFNWNARKSRVRLIRSQTGEWAKPDDDTAVEIGDTIFIPEKPERDYWQLSRDLIAVAAQLATIFLVIY
ncbi:MAG TPA: SLBB domain-containing protein, partial [bacterium]|nr:SLBB domain-containing protein [bacterium]